MASQKFKKGDVVEWRGAGGMKWGVVISMVNHKGYRVYKIANAGATDENDVSYVATSMLSRKKAE